MNFNQYRSTKLSKIIAKCSCIALISVFFVNNSISQRKIAYNPDQKFSPAQLQTDFQLLRTAIEQFHPGAFLYTPKDSVERYFNLYLATLNDSLTERQFRNQLMKVTEIIKCGHSGISSSDRRQKYFKNRPYKMIPLDLCFVDSQLYILSNFSKDSSLRKGMQILEIEGIAVGDIFKTMYEANGSDGWNGSNRLYAFQHNVEFQYNRFYPEKDTFHLIIKDTLNRAVSTRLAAMLSDSLPFTKGKPKKSIYTNDRNRFFLYEKDSTVAVLDLYAEEVFGYNRFYRKSFRYLKKHQINKLVIDLRGNGGGFLLNPGVLLGYLLDSSDHILIWREKKYIPFKDHLVGRKFVGITEAFFPLLPHVIRDRSNKSRFNLMVQFKPRKKWHFDGSLEVLIDGGTFSAATCIAAYLKKYNRARFIGQETGGAASGCNAFLTPYLILPETKLKYMLPLYRVENQVVAEKFGRGVFPDIETMYNIQDILQGRDLEFLHINDQ
ncbi:MAG: S41 family peptidase [Saprospiraceae bacterium]